MRAVAKKVAFRDERLSHSTAGRWLKEDGITLRTNRKRLARKQSPERNAQFLQVQALRERFHAAGQPVISKDAKKRELIGQFKNQGKARTAAAIDVNSHDFLTDAIGVAIPDAILDDCTGDADVVIGTGRNTPSFAAANVALWWKKTGTTRYPEATDLLLLVDAGGANSCRSHQWKRSLHAVAIATGLRITVAHYPTGASKWNPVEHEVLGRISQHWAGVPLNSYKTIQTLIRTATTRRGMPIRVHMDRRTWSGKPKQTGTPWIVPHQHRPLWNYTLLPLPSPEAMIRLL
jgi:hypothetical protein